MATQTALSVQEFLELPDREGVRREYDSGDLIEMPPVGMKHSLTLTALVGTLQGALRSEYLVAAGSGFALADDIFRIPDAFVIARDRAGSLQTRSGWQIGAPESAIEIVSPNDDAADLDRKVRQYPAAGSQAVWVIYPDARHVIAFRRDGFMGDYAADSQIEDPEFFGRPVAIGLIVSD